MTLRYGLCAGYATTLGYGCSGIYIVRALQGFVGIAQNGNAVAVDRRTLTSHIVKDIEFPEAEICLFQPSANMQ